MERWIHLAVYAVRHNVIHLNILHAAKKMVLITQRNKLEIRNKILKKFLNDVEEM